MSNKNNPPEDNISAFFQDHERVTHALQLGINAALLKHKQAGNPVCEWKDGKVVWIPSDQIPIDTITK